MVLPGPDFDDDFDMISVNTVPAAQPGPGSVSSPADRIAAIRHWLQPTDYLSPGNEYMKHLHAHVPGTGDWMLQSPVFQTWSSPDHTPTPCLHLRGVAGSGKSVLAASVIRHLQHSGPKVPVLFFFFRQIVDKNHSSQYLVRDFAAQLLPHSQPLTDVLDGLSKSQGVSDIRLEQLWSYIIETLRQLPRVFCVVDALDEMDEADFDFITNLKSLIDTKPNGVRLLVTSRPIPKIEHVLKDPSILREKLDSSMLYPDVARYVTVSMATLEPSLRPETEDRVRDTICERAKGLFLHARLMTEHLTESLRMGLITEDELPERLEESPQSLIEVYEQLLAEHARRSKVTQTQQASILSCVIHARRPLRLIELGALIARMRGDDNLREGKRLIRASCGRLLEILEDESASVIHHSFTEFLRNLDRQATPDAFPVLDEKAGHSTMAIISLAYLNGCPTLDEDESLFDKFDELMEMEVRSDTIELREKAYRNLQLEHPLVNYAAENLVFHIQHAEPYTSELLNALDDQLAPGKPAFSILGYSRNRWWHGPRYQTLNTLHVVIDHGLTSYALHLIDKRPSWKETPNDRGMTPLSCAAEQGMASVVEALLCRGADAMARDNSGLSALHYAACRGHADAAKLLLDHGVDPMIPKLKEDADKMYFFGTSDKGTTAFQYALNSGKPDVVRLFLPFLYAENANACLHWAQDAESMEAILETGHAAVDSFRQGLTLLFQAASHHNLAKMRVLLKHGADPNKRCTGRPVDTDDGPITIDGHFPRGPTALHAFCGYSNQDAVVSDEDDVRDAEECFALLIESGVKLDATTDGDEAYSHYTHSPKGMSALHYAVRRRSHNGWLGHYSHKALTELTTAGLLLRAGVDPNARSTDGASPLFYANVGQPEVIDLLIQHGADVNVRADSGRTPLLSLILCTDPREFDTKICQSLIDHGANVKLADEQGQTIMHIIFSRFDSFRATDKPLLEALLRAGADFTSTDTMGQPPLLSLSSTNPDRALFEFLIDEGLDLNARDVKGNTVMFKLVRSYYSSRSVFCMLQSLGADVAIVNDHGESLLHIAAESGASIEWFELLLEAGLSAEIVSPKGMTLVHHVLKSTSLRQETLDILSLLVKHGAVPARRTGEGRTPLHIASLRDDDNGYTSGDNRTWLDVVLQDPIFGFPDVNTRDHRGLTALHLAASVSEYKVGMLLRAGANPTAITNGGVSVLHIACRTSQPGVVAVLLTALADRGVLPDFIGACGEGINDGRTPLHSACQSGCADSVRLLLQHGADAHAVDARGQTPLHYLAGSRCCSATRDDKSVAEAMIEADGDEPFWRDTCDPSQWPDDGVDILHALVRAGVDLDARVEGDQTAEDMARDVGYSNLCSALSELRQGDQRPSNDHNIESSDAVQALLDIADSTEIARSVGAEIKRGNRGVIKEFAQRGGDLIALSRCGQMHSFWYMVNSGQTELLRHFVKELSAVDMKARERHKDMLEDQRIKGIASGFKERMPRGVLPMVERDMESLLAMACSRAKPNLAVIRVLVEEAGLDVNEHPPIHASASKFERTTPLHILATGQYFWQIEALEYLLAHGADVNATNSHGRSPLHVAISTDWPCGFWREGTVRVLLKHGGDPNASDSRSGSTPLAMSDHAGVTRALLEHGADISQAHGVLVRAVLGLDFVLARALLEAGASANDLVAETGPWVCDRHPDAYPAALMAPDASKYIIHVAAGQVFQENLRHSRAVWELQKASTIDVLLSQGADVALWYKDGSNVLQRFVEEGIPLQPFFPALRDVDIERIGLGGRTLLISACIPRVVRHRQCFSNSKVPTVIHLEAAAWLLDNGARWDVSDDRGRQPIHWMCTMEDPFDEAHKAIFERLLSLSDGSELERMDVDGRTPLFLSLQARQTWAATRLIEQGAVLPPADTNGDTGLHVLAAGLFGNKEMAEPVHSLFTRLLRLGADINTRNKRGETPLFIFLSRWWPTKENAIRGFSYCDILPLFLDAGAHLQVLTVQGWSLLHAVAGQERGKDYFHGYQQDEELGSVFERLLELGLDPRQEDDKLRSPLDMAVPRGWHSIVDLFSDEGKRRLEARKRSSP